jgi:sterol desaturase/sphingolipid hydroxylase (fatty acid hydroxylase superfamily)
MYFLIIIIIILFFLITISHKNYPKRKDEINYEYIKNITINFFIALAFGYYLNTYCKNIFNINNTIKIQNIIFHLLIVDALFYWTHRTIHRIPILKQILHEKHHNVKNLIPLDSLHNSHIEYILDILIIHYLPIFFIDISMIEYNISSLIILIYSIYLHYDIKYPLLPGFISSVYHKKHHEIGGGNYSMFFPIWDDYMNTKIKKTKQNKKCKTKTKNVKPKQKM